MSVNGECRTFLRLRVLISIYWDINREFENDFFRDLNDLEKVKIEREKRMNIF